jgi:type I restriction enzyme S subunit/type I restriction enzyme M protein
MTAALPSLANLKPNPAWASLPLFDRAGWKRVWFGGVVENCAETCVPAALREDLVCGIRRFRA